MNFLRLDIKFKKLTINQVAELLIIFIEGEKNISQKEDKDQIPIMREVIMSNLNKKLTEFKSKNLKNEQTDFDIDLDKNLRKRLKLLKISRISFIEFLVNYKNEII